MRDRMQELWDGAVPVGVPCPQADPAAVKRRVNAALNAVPSERRAYMRHKIRFAAAAAAIAALLAGSALAVASRWNVLDFYFEGDNTPVEDYVSHETYSIRDDNYTLSVISSVADTSSAYLLVTIEAKNDAAAAAHSYRKRPCRRDARGRWIQLWGKGGAAHGDLPHLQYESR